jgi:hypothetical protein
MQLGWLAMLPPRLAKALHAVPLKWRAWSVESLSGAAVHAAALFRGTLPVRRGGMNTQGIDRVRRGTRAASYGREGGRLATVTRMG